MPRASEISYVLTKDALVGDAKLARALTSKDGKPDYPKRPLQMRWNMTGRDALPRADCATEGDTAHCTITAPDGPLLAVERGSRRHSKTARATRPSTRSHDGIARGTAHAGENDAVRAGVMRAPHLSVHSCHRVVCLMTPE
jgi:hypothetical protein